MLAVHSQKAFDRYAEPLGLALRAYPTVLVWHPSVSCETFAARFRDAVKGGLRYGHTNSLVPKGLFDAHAHKLTVAIRSSGLDKNYVVIGTPLAIKEHDAQASTPTPQERIETSDEIFVDTRDTIVATMMCELMARHVFGKTVVFVLGPLDEGTAKALEERYNVTLTQVPGKPDLFTLL